MTVGMSEEVGEIMEGAGLNVGIVVTVEANVGLGVDTAEESGAKITAIPPMQ